MTGKLIALLMVLLCAACGGGEETDEGECPALCASNVRENAPNVSNEAIPIAAR